MEKTEEGGHDLACQGITFVALDGAARLIDTSQHSGVQHFFSHILIGQAPPFEETPDWLKLAYTAERTGDDVAPASTVLVPSAMLEGDSLFPAI